MNRRKFIATGAAAALTLYGRALVASPTAEEKAQKLGAKNYSTFGNCCQSTLATVQEVAGGVPDIVVQAGDGFAGGGGTTFGTCGALAGGLLALGCKAGRPGNELDDKTSYKKFRALPKGLSEKFKAKYGGCTCREVKEKFLGKSLDDATEDDKKRMKTDLCPGVVGQASAWVVAEL
jgi:C_GCAxxG_C_C family probable redox protein